MIGRFGLWIDKPSSKGWGEPQDNWHFGLWFTCPNCRGMWDGSTDPYDDFQCAYCHERGVVTLWWLARFYIDLELNWKWLQVKCYFHQRWGKRTFEVCEFYDRVVEVFDSD